jgi:hypothetical protein
MFFTRRCLHLLMETLTVIDCRNPFRYFLIFSKFGIIKKDPCFVVLNYMCSLIMDHDFRHAAI